MSTSSNRMDMESEGKDTRGVFIRKRVFICGGVFILATLVVVAFLSHYLTHCECDSSSTDGSEGSPRPTPLPTAPAIADVRLPKTLRPIHYQLQLQPFLNNFTFSGNVVIHMQCVEDTNVITLHANNLSIHNESIGLLAWGSHVPRVTYYDYDSQCQFLQFYLNDSLKSSNYYNLSLEFNGVLNDNLVGFYRSKFGNDKWMATTQFQPTDARRAFPCFDEPGMKAQFTVSLAHPKGYISISNMPQKVSGKAIDDSWELDEYFTTPNMSTYLLAFVVTNFSYVEQKSKGGVHFRVYSRKEALDQTQFAIETGPRMLDFYDDFFEIPYPLPKQDMIAIPDFAAGAMENWGLITYRETALLFDPHISSTEDKENVAVVVAHELAHQWFGNLVSPAWWDDLWLNEGFASYMENVAVDHYFKEYKMMERLSRVLQNVLEHDSLKTSHPISVPVNNPEQINELFDTISYNKGLSIIRMMVHFLGNDAFKRGLKTYFEEKKYSNAVQDDLWRHMSQAVKRTGPPIDVKNIMDTWTIQTGYPVVTVSRNNHEQSVILTQRVFHLVPEKKSEISRSVKWEIPITFTSQVNPNFENTLPKKWMHNSTSETSITFTRHEGIPPADQWVIFNVQQTGYYRVNYQKENWVMLTKQLLNDHTVIHVLNRAQLIDDAFNLAKAGELDYTITLNLTRYLTKETELVPWESTMSNFAYIDGMLRATEVYGMWKKFLLKLVEPHYKAIGFKHLPNTDENHIDLIRQGMFIAKACHVELGDCINTCVTLYNEWITNGTKISPNLRDIVLCRAISKGTAKVWNEVWDKYLNSNVMSEKSSFLSALTCTQEPWILNKMLNIILQPDGPIRYQDSTTVIYGLSRNKVGRYLLAAFIKDKLKKINEIFSGAFIFPKIVKAGFYNLNTPYELRELKDFVAIHSALLKSADRTMTQVIEETESNVMWMNRNYETIKKWLETEEGI